MIHVRPHRDRVEQANFADSPIAAGNTVFESVDTLHTETLVPAAQSQPTQGDRAVETLEIEISANSGGNAVYGFPPLARPRPQRAGDAANQ